MGVWKVLGGAALGVATIVALPVAGPVGAITALGAAAAAGVGALGGAVASSVEDDDNNEAKKAERERGQEEGRREEKTRSAIEYSAKEQKLKEALDALKLYKESEESSKNKILALCTFAAAVSWANGAISESEMREMKDMMTGVAGNYYLSDMNERINKLLYNHISVEDSLQCLYDNNLFSRKTLPILNDIIDCLILVDDQPEKHELKTLLNQHLIG